MYRIGASVGQDGVNKHDDVLIVQTLLNKNAHMVESIGRVPEDGNFDASTGRAIIAFQHDVVRIATPDGRVDPNGRTFRTLLGDVPHGATVAFVELPGAGNGYYLYSNQDKQWGTPSAIQSIQVLAESLIKAGITIGVGDISYANGGRMPPHASHRRGIDVDIRPQRTDGTHAAVYIGDPHYSQANTRKIVEELHKDENLSFIFFNDKKFDGVRFYVGHDNHLHVRFKQ